MPKPFLKWAGGKTQLLEEIKHRFPCKEKDKFIYIEPFIGGGAVLFWVLNNHPNVQKVIISDTNVDLINTYREVKYDVEQLISILYRWEGEYQSLLYEQRKEYYYAKRSFFNQRNASSTVQAALFILLNHTCFNGLYRVNRKNEFNVPIGSYKKPRICDVSNLRTVNKALRNVEIVNKDFEDTGEYAEGNTVFYFDPPYKQLNKTSNFNSYTKKSFVDNDQIRLKDFCAQMDSKKYKWLLSNSDHSFFDTLYRKYTINRVLARRSINTKGTKRGQIPELLISNCVGE